MHAEVVPSDSVAVQLKFNIAPASTDAAVGAIEIDITVGTVGTVGSTKTSMGSSDTANVICWLLALNATGARVSRFITDTAVEPFGIAIVTGVAAGEALVAHFAAPVT